MPIFDELSAAQIVLLIGALGLGAFVQGAVGFAYGLISTPLLIWIGLPLPTAVAWVLTAVLTQTLTGCWRFRRSIVWRDLPGMMVGRMLGLPAGLVMMGWLTERGVDAVKQGIGAVLLGVVLLIGLLRPEPRERVSRRWVAPVGLSSGALSGLTGMGGPPLVLWVVAHDWPTERSRVYLWALFLQLMPIQLALMVWKFGPTVAWAVLGGLMATPLIVVAGDWGSRLGSRWSRQRLRTITLGVLMLMAVVSIAGPWLG
ncbi:MAG: sulfite exporter TauE/SafE family protein [Planctomycetota bacterium]